MGGFVKISLAFALMLAVAPAHATTWGKSKAKDPVSGRAVEVHEPMSSGSYIYQWPGKEDQVFWPYTDDHWLWFNPKSGYGAFGSEFEQLEGQGLEKVKAWLADNYDKTKPPNTRLEKLAWLERLYAQRDMDENFWCFYYRLMAYENAEANPALSLEYVRKALPLIEKQLAAAEEGYERIPLLYLLGEYHRRLGLYEQAAGYFDQARKVSFKDEQGVNHDGSEYFNELIKEREALGMAPPAPAG
jgi:tetratricopeptide (TPR) repeat protein